MQQRQAVDEVYADGPDTVIAGAAAPSGTARKVEGGYRVSGSWAYSSASLHADRASGGVFVVDDHDQPIDQAMALIPEEDFRIEDTWLPSGAPSPCSARRAAQSPGGPATAEHGITYGSLRTDAQRRMVGPRRLVKNR